MPCAPCAGHKAAAQTPHRHAPGDGDRARAERRRRSGPAARAPQPPTAECRRPARPRRAASGGQAPPLGTRDSGLARRPANELSPAAPQPSPWSRPLPPSLPPSRRRPSRSTDRRRRRCRSPDNNRGPPRTAPANGHSPCWFEPRLLPNRASPSSLPPPPAPPQNGCLFLHTAHGGGASGRHRDAPVREQGRVHALLSACVHGLSPTNGRTDQSEWTAAGRYPIKTSPASKGGGSPGTTAGLANGGLVGGFPRLLGGDSLVSESCLVGNSCGRRFSRAFSQTPRTS